MRMAGQGFSSKIDQTLSLLSLPDINAPANRHCGRGVSDV
jgi:hypothetical protein